MSPTIKAAMRARGLDVGVPRRPESDVSLEDAIALGELVRVIERDERTFAAEH